MILASYGSMLSTISMFLVGSAVLLIVFTITWLIQLKTRNAGIVDPIWSMSFPLLVIIYLVVSEFNRGSFVHLSIAKIIFTGMVVIWGMRLGIHLLIRVLHEKHEDVRYAALRDEWGDRQNLLMLRFYYFQMILAVVLSLPFALILANDELTLGILEISGIVIWTIAVVGETIADAQLKSFKANPANKGKVCDKGLWYYSRHPNYFFEWLIWMSFFVFASGSPLGLITIICPALMLYFLMKVTGIPYTEKQSVKSKGQAYIEYQKMTSAFVPLPKRSSK